jgi:lysyl endopeptidase
MSKKQKITGLHTSVLMSLVILISMMPHTLSAQVSYEGEPLAFGAENKSLLHSAVDYFVEMPKFNVDSIRAIDDLPGNRIGGLGFAYKFYKDLTPENSGITFNTEDGTKIWKLGIRSPGAYSINILFSEFKLPDNAKLFLYNSDRSRVLGAFTNKNRPEGGEFSIAPVEGDELTVEYHEPANAEFSGRIRISEINHDYRGLFRLGTRFDKSYLPCLPDITCDAKYDTIAGSVCLLIVNGNTYCTGTLLNNTAQNGKPYLLTASHCLKNNASLGNRVVAFLNYQSPRCDRRIRGSEEFSVSGSVTRALSNEVDFALLELTDLPPADYRPYLAGWTNDTTTYDDLPFTCIHHPYGEVKKYCVENDSVTKKNWTGTSDGIAANNHWNVRQWEIGHTWAGASGAPLFDKNMRFRGGLTGGDSGGESGCGSYTSGDFFFRFDRAWDQFPDSTKQLKHWLDPSCPSYAHRITTLKGYNPYSDNPSIRVTNILPTDSLGKIYLKSPYSGSMFGQNAIGYSQYAEHFTAKDSMMVKGVYLMAAKGSKSSTSPVTVRVFSGGIAPGAVLYKEILNPNYISYSNETFSSVSKSDFTDCENYLRFNKPVSVGTDFYIGYEVSYALEVPEDSFYVYAALRDSKTINTAYFKSNFLWFPFSSHFFQPIQTSMWIEPLIQRDTNTEHEPYVEIDTDSIVSDVPLYAFSKQESMLYIWLPFKWVDNTNLNIFDLSGRLVKQAQIKTPLFNLNFSPAYRNLYFIRISTASGKVFKGKFMWSQ